MQVKTFALRGNENNALTVYIQDPIRPGQRRPILISCPGGGFLDCSPNEGDPVAQAFMRLGYHGAVLTYTRAASSAEPSWPNALYDLAAGVRIIREHAEEWGVSQVVVCGFSAGGHLVTSYGNEWAGELFADADEPADLRRPDAVVAGYPIVDYRGTRAQIETLERSVSTAGVSMEEVLGKQGESVGLLKFIQVTNHAFLGDAELSDELEARVSPICNVNDATPPTFLWTTFADPIVDPTKALEYAKTLRVHDVPCELHVFMNGTHGLSTADRAAAKKDDYIDSHIAHWPQLAAEWLDMALD